MADGTRMINLFPEKSGQAMPFCVGSFKTIISQHARFIKKAAYDIDS